MMLRCACPWSTRPGTLPLLRILVLTLRCIRLPLLLTRVLVLWRQGERLAALEAELGVIRQQLPQEALMAISETLPQVFEAGAGAMPNDVGDDDGGGGGEFLWWWWRRRRRGSRGSRGRGREEVRMAISETLPQVCGPGAGAGVMPKDLDTEW
eukprot:3921027-Rhodomonas_salina.1